MRFTFTYDEILYIKKKFHFGDLIGFAEEGHAPSATEKSLINSGIILTDRRYPELKNEIRYLFSAWEKMRYSAACPYSIDDDHFHCILASEKNIIVVQQNALDYTLDIFDFKKEEMDNLFCMLSRVDPMLKADKTLNISMDVSDLESLLEEDRDIFPKTLEKQTGISADVYIDYADVISEDSSDKANVILIEDHARDTGCMCKIVNSEKGVYALKHITYSDREKAVLLIGNAQNIIDSFYVLD